MTSPRTHPQLAPPHLVVTGELKPREMMGCYGAAVVCLISAISLVECANFDCPPLPPLARPARNIYELRPQDIKVVMALGDSVTAGFGMMGGHGIDGLRDLTEYRGQSWSIGMDDRAQTVPNFLRTYTPDLVGGSVGHHTLEFCYNFICPPFQYHKKDIFNAAQSGAMITNIVSHEFDHLLKKLKEHKDVDMQNDWKLLTVFIGANDLCLSCSGDIPTLTVDDYEKHLREILEEVRTHIPKVFVNMVLMGNISQIYQLSLKSEECSDVHRVLFIECLCAFTPGELGDLTRLDMDRMAMGINQRMRKIAAGYASLKKNVTDDFAVVVQPFVSEAAANKFPVEYLSSLDCFHPSMLAHQSMAKALWNNMITPAALKKKTFNLHEHITCPTNTTLIYTN